VNWKSISLLGLVVACLGIGLFATKMPDPSKTYHVGPESCESGKKLCATECAWQDFTVFFCVESSAAVSHGTYDAACAAWQGGKSTLPYECN
jgi:hypothetical protein